MDFRALAPLQGLHHAETDRRPCGISITHESDRFPSTRCQLVVLTPDELESHLRCQNRICPSNEASFSSHDSHSLPKWTGIAFALLLLTNPSFAWICFSVRSLIVNGRACFGLENCKVGMATIGYAYLGIVKNTTRRARADRCLNYH